MNNNNQNNNFIANVGQNWFPVTNDGNSVPNFVFGINQVPAISVNQVPVFNNGNFAFASNPIINPDFAIGLNQAGVFNNVNLNQVQPFNNVNLPLGLNPVPAINNANLPFVLNQVPSFNNNVNFVPNFVTIPSNAFNGNLYYENDDHLPIIEEIEDDVQANDVQPNDVQVNDVQANDIPSTSGINRNGRTIRPLAEIREEGLRNLRELEQGGIIIQRGRGIGNYTEVISNSSVHNRQFRVESRVFSFKFKENTGNIPLEDFLLHGFGEILEYAKRGVSPEALIGVKINAVSGQTTGPIGISFRPSNTLTSEMVLDLIFSVSQSNASFSVQEALEMTVTILRPRYGGAVISIRYKSDAEILRTKARQIIDPGVCTDYLCLPKSLILGKLFIDENHQELLRLGCNPSALNSEAQKLVRKANVQVVAGRGCNMLDIYKFQKILPGYSLIVHNNKKSGNKIYCHAGSGQKRINLFYFQDLQHFIFIKNRMAFFGAGRECRACFYLFNHPISEHKCKKLCQACKTPGLCLENTHITCNLCDREFFGTECYQNHFVNTIKTNAWDDTVCKSIFSCKDCGKIVDMSVRRGKRHTCGEFFCKLCFVYVPENHFCYIKQHIKQTPANFIFVFFDLECTQDTQTGIATYKHEPNLCISQHVCNRCYQVNDMAYFCENCEGQRKIFFSPRCVKDFVDFLDDFEDQKVIAMAHNLSGYDGMFILSELANRRDDISPTMVGWKVVRLQYKNITFLDSLLFLTMGLSKVPEAFGLGDIGKGYFPHFFNTHANLGYSGNMPAREMYGPDGFNEKEKKKFDDWYNDQVARNVQFVTRDELVKYCDMDVTILRKGCLKFMEIFKQTLDINPLLEATTLASAIMLGFRKKFVKPYTLGIVPVHGYNTKKKNSSKIGDKWLEYEENKAGRKFIREYKIPFTNLYVDGFDPRGISPQGRNPRGVCYEMFGCIWHGCPRCYKYRPPSALRDSLDDRYESTMKRLDKLQQLGYTLCVMWECDFKKFLKENPPINIELENCPAIAHGPLNARDAIYGGLVDVFRTHYEIKPGEKILYYDFKSLYPYVNKNECYPIKHPTIYRGRECIGINIAVLHGLIKCKILPPRRKFHPVLPMKVFDRMITPLCRTCAEHKSHPCTHNTVEERALVGTWVLAEVNYAIELGYQMIEIYEVWSYEVKVYNPTTKRGGVFTKYMDLFIKLKEEASGWPRDDMTEEEKRRYIADFLEAEGVALDYDNIEKNPAMRQLSKLCLNSLWGKTIENSDKMQSAVFREPKKFFDLIASPGIEISEVLPFGEKSVWVKWKYIGIEHADPIKHQCIPLGAFTTAYGRIRLHREILSKLSYDDDDLESNLALYCDTDSIYFVQRPNQRINLPIGDYLGMLTNELLEYGPNAYIIKLVGIGPKSYSFVVYNPDDATFVEVSKCKGITQCVRNMDKLTFENFKRLVDGSNSVRDVAPIVFENPKKIKKTKDFNVVSVKELKKIKFTVNKRVCVANNITVPYGYV